MTMYGGLMFMTAWQDGHLVRSLRGHGHWVNTLALSTEYAVRTGAFRPQRPGASRTLIRRVRLRSHGGRPS